MLKEEGEEEQEEINNCHSKSQFLLIISVLYQKTIAKKFLILLHLRRLNFGRTVGRMRKERIREGRMKSVFYGIKSVFYRMEFVFYRMEFVFHGMKSVFFRMESVFC